MIFDFKGTEVIFLMIIIYPREQNVNLINQQKCCFCFKYYIDLTEDNPGHSE
jgi:hypothetical protein